MLTVQCASPGPTGSQHLPLTLAEDKSGFHLAAPLVASGQYTLSVLMDGADVLGSPAHLSVVAREVHLQHCLLQGPGLHSCKAGEAATFSIFARDAYGNAVTRGGTKFVVKILDKEGHTADGMFPALQPCYLCKGIACHSKA